MPGTHLGGDMAEAPDMINVFPLLLPKRVLNIQHRLLTFNMSFLFVWLICP